MNFKEKNTLLNWFSLALVVFYFLYSFLLISEYTVYQGLFFSFSLLAYLGLGLAGLFGRVELALCSMALAFPQALVWVIDAIWYSFFTASLFGTAEGRFIPGISNTNFILSHYPLFVLPISVIFIRLLPRPNKPPFILMGLISVTALLISRFIFTGVADPNCSQLACVPGLDSFSPKVYPWVFLILYTLVCLSLVGILSSYAKRENSKSPFLNFPKTSILLCCLFCASIVVNDLVRYKSLPKFSCTSTPPISSVQLSCQHTMDYSPGFFYLFFLATNKSSVAKHCNFQLINNGKKETMYAAVLLKPNEKLHSSVVLPFPTESSGMSVVLSSECVSFE